MQALLSLKMLGIYSGKGGKSHIAHADVGYPAIG